MNNHKYTKETLLKLMDNKKVPYILHNHRALFTVQDSEKHRGEIDGMHSKNLFLKNKKKEFFLFSCYENQKIDLKKISKSLKIGNISFASEEKLIEIMGIYPGSVSPFALLNDKNNNVVFFLDKKIFETENINFHPLINTSTVTLKVRSLIKLLIEKNKNVNIFDFDKYSLIDTIKNE